MRTTKIAFRRRRAEILRFTASKAFRSAAAISSIECVDAGFTVGSRLFEATAILVPGHEAALPLRSKREMVMGR
jgi:hypothetical protein